MPKFSRFVCLYAERLMQLSSPDALILRRRMSLVCLVGRCAAVTHVAETQFGESEAPSGTRVDETADDEFGFAV
jgi:hypothetical protein